MARCTIETERRHAEEMGPLIQKLMADAGLALGQLDLLVVDRGPGRFTGLRVGLATVRSLAFALRLPMVGLTSLEILASGPRVTGHPRHAEDPTVTAVIDARRHEVFQQTFVAGQPVGPAVVGPATEVAATAAGLVVGDGLDRYEADYRSLVSVVPLIGVTVDPATMLALAAGREPGPRAGVEALYLRDPDVNPSVKTRPRT
jgi:tRNA threonylcarbamoyladenosine biosynthesis protein TsaB